MNGEVFGFLGVISLLIFMFRVFDGTTEPSSGSPGMTDLVLIVAILGFTTLYLMAKPGGPLY